jgi:hypothetical protein
VVKTLAAVSIFIGLLAGLIISAVWEKPSGLETTIARSQWESERTNAILYNRSEPAEPDWDGRPGLARHPWIVGASTSVVIFITGLLAITAVNTQSQTAPRAVPDDDYDPDADLFEAFDDPYEEPAPRRAQIRVNPRRKFTSERS